MKISKKKLSKTKYPELSTIILLFCGSIGTAIQWIYQGITNKSSNIFAYFMLFIGMILLCMALIKKRKLIKVDMIVVPIFFVIAYLFSSFNSATLYEIHRQSLLINTFVTAMPIYFAIRLSRDYECLWNKFLLFSKCSLVLHVIAFFLVDVGSRENYRSFSNGLFLVCAIFIIEWLYNDNKKFSLLTLMCGVLIATCGRRSSLVSLLFILAVICVLKKKYKIIAIGVVIALIICFLWMPILTSMLSFFSSFGVRPRILVRIIAGNVTDDSHRFEQWAYVFQLLFSSFKNTILGLGIAGERHYMLSHFSHMILQGYPHGMLVEIIGHYGIIMGTILEAFLFAIYPIRFCIKLKKKNEIMKIFLLSICLLSALFFQDSYLQSRWFFLYIGVLMTFDVYKKSNVGKNWIDSVKIKKRNQLRLRQ